MSACLVGQRGHRFKVRLLRSRTHDDDTSTMHASKLVAIKQEIERQEREEREIAEERDREKRGQAEEREERREKVIL